MELTETSHRVFDFLKLVCFRYKYHSLVTDEEISRMIVEHNLPLVIRHVLEKEKLMSSTLSDTNNNIKKYWVWEHQGEPTITVAVRVALSLSEYESLQKSNQMKKLNKGMWSNEDLQFLIENYEKMSNELLGEKINRSPNAVYSKMWKINTAYKEIVKEKLRRRPEKIVVKNPMDDAQLVEVDEPRVTLVSAIPTPKRSKKRWNNDEIDYLSRTLDASLEDVAYSLNRSVKSIVAARFAYERGILVKTNKRVANNYKIKKPSLFRRLFNWIPRIKIEKR